MSTRRPAPGRQGLPADTACAQVAQWLKYLPIGGSWNDLLGERPR